MTRRLSFAVLFFVTLVVTLISFSAKAQERTQFENGMCSDAVHEKCVSNAYNRFIEVHRDYDRWCKDLAACKFRFNAWQAKWQEYLNKWHQKCEGKALQLDCYGGPDEPEKTDPGSRLGCLNTLARMDPSVIDRQNEEVWQIEREARRRQEAVTRLAVLGPDDVPKPAATSVQQEKPKVPLSEAEAEEAIALVGSYAVATNSALSTPPQPPATSSPTAATPPKVYDFQAERYNQWRTAHPGAVVKANKPAQQVTASAVISKVKINCIPEHVNVVRIADNGDLTLFIHAGADITALQRCLPNHDFDAVKVVSGNIAAATIPYYLEYADRPMNKNKLHFHQGRWHLKRSEWKTLGKEFFADFFRDNSGKDFGFALQGGQRLELSAKVESIAPNKAEPKAESNEPAKHGKYERVQPEEKQLRLASVDFANHPASEYEPTVAEMSAQLVSSSEAVLPKASSQNGSNYSDVMLSIPPTGEAILIRAGPRVTRAMYISKTRHRRGDEADLNLQENFVRNQAQDRLPYREHYGQFAFG